MKIRAVPAASGRVLVRRSMATQSVAAAVAAILAGAGSAAYADAAASSDSLEEVVVTGIRHSIEASIATKKESDSIVESISAEDIGKLPDTSIADSIARLPGLAAQRIDGRPAAISIRGLGPDYAGALLNGRQVVSSSDGRSAEYDQFPSELVNQVVVYKTVDASVVGQGLSGTIDIKPLMPLSLDKRQLVFGARGERNSNGKLSSTGNGASGNRFSASYVDQFADHTIGVAVGFAHLDSPGQEKKYEAWRYGDYAGQSPYKDWGASATGLPTVGTAGDLAQTQQGFEASNTSSKQVRDGLMAVVEFKPNDSFTSAVDLYYSKFSQDRVGHHWVGDVGIWSGGAAYSNVGTGVVDGNTVVASGTVGNAHSLIYDKNFHRTDKIKSIGWRNELQLSEGWNGTADIGYSKADRDELYIQSVARAAGTSTFTFSGTDTVDQAAWSTAQDLTDPTVVQLTNDPNWAELRDPKYSDTIKSIQLSAKGALDWGFIKSVDVGLAVNKRDKDVTSNQYRLNLASTNVAIPAGALRDPVTISVGNISQQILSWDVPSIMSLYTLEAKDPWTAKDAKYAVHEKVTTAFAKFNIDSTVGSVPVRGNVGVQIVRSDQSADGYAWNSGGAAGSGAVVPVSGGAIYTDFMPSLNLVFSLKPDLLLRLGLGKNMARPRMDDMRAGADQPHLEPLLSAPSGNPVDPGKWVAGNGGKPDLKPWRARAVDLSLEKYFSKRSYVAAAGFYKHLDSFIYQRATVRDFTGFPNYNSALTPGCSPLQPNCNPNLGEITTQDNGSGGSVYGMEFSASLDGGLLWHGLDGFGVIASESVTHNSLPKDGNGNTINLDGFSGTVNSFALYYEKAGFSARISQRYRSAFTATTRGLLLNTETSTHIDAEKQVDAQLDYSFNSGALKGLSVLLQANNLTNEPAIQRRTPEVVGPAGNINGLLPWKYDDFGRVLLLGVTYKL